MAKKNETVQFLVNGKIIESTQEAFKVAKQYFGAVLVADAVPEKPVELIKPLITPPKLKIISPEVPAEVKATTEPVKTAEPVAAKKPARKPVKKPAK